MDEIKKLKTSLDFNAAKKQIMRKELEKKKLISKQIIEDIPRLIKREDKRMYLEVLVKNKIFELENDELEYNLRLQEKFNMILVEEIKRLREDCEKNNLSIGRNDFLDNIDGNDKLPQL